MEYLIFRAIDNTVHRRSLSKIVVVIILNIKNVIWQLSIKNLFERILSVKVFNVKL